MIDKKIFSFLLMIMASGNVFSQRVNLNAFNNVNIEKYNPGAIGWENAIVSHVGVRSQWVGINGMPKMQYLNISMPLHRLNSGVGFDVTHIELGIFKTTNVALSYNYKIVNKRNLKVGIGLNMKLSSISVDKDAILTPEGRIDNGVYNSFDESIDLLNDLNSDFGMSSGVFARYKKWDIGLSFVNFLAKPLKKDLGVFLNRHYICNLRTELELSNRFVLKPSILFRYDFVEWQGEALANIEVVEKYNIYVGARGGDKRHNDALLVGVGGKVVGEVHLGYIFEYGISELSDVVSGSHEIKLTYKFGKLRMQQRKPPIIYSPMYL